MCDIIHQRQYKFWLRFESIFKFTSFFEQQKKLLSIIHGLTNKVMIRIIVKSPINFFMLCISWNNAFSKVIKNKKEKYIQNKAKGIIPPTIEELSRDSDTDTGLANNAKTLADTVFKGYRDDLDFNDENDVGK